MGERLLNGRAPKAWEVAAVERGRACEMDRDMASLAGLLTAGAPPERAARPVTDLAVDFATARRPK